MLNDIYQGLDPIAFSLGPLVVRWYGLAYVLGFVCAAAIIYFVAKRWKLGMSEDNLATLMVCHRRRGAGCAHRIRAVLRRRLLPVPSAGDTRVQPGGMSFHGGLVGLLIGGAVAARMTRIPFLTLADLGSIAAPIGLFFGRCANFVNGELWGAPTDGPLGVVFGGAAGMMPRHPSQLYEAVLEDRHLLRPVRALAQAATEAPGHLPRRISGALRHLPLPHRVRARARRATGIPVGRLAHHGPSALGTAHRGRYRALLIYAARTRHPQARPQEIQPPSVPGDAA